MTSAALFINYLYDICPSYTEQKVAWYIHSGKQHGLTDCIDLALKYDIVITPDSSSNDYVELQKLSDNGTVVIILDHHEAKEISPATNVHTINNQLCDYKNKYLSGVGVVWQFCRYLDKRLDFHYADQYLDLVATGLHGDMMSMLSIETAHLIKKGFNMKNIKNPFILGMYHHNQYSIGDYITPMGASFYIIPLLNAICRSGTAEEKQIVFKSMLKFLANKKVLSTKRGHKLGEEELLVDQAIRICVNVKNRQTRAEEAGLELLEGKIAAEDMLQHKVLLFLLEPGQVDPNIRGLIANKLMAKYQRCCCVLTKTQISNEDIPPWEESSGEIYYAGSARAYSASGLTNFKDICEEIDGVRYAQGHQGAFGLAINEDAIDNFLQITDTLLAHLPAEPVYTVDYSWSPQTICHQAILDIADMDMFWGQDFPEPFVLIENVDLTPKNLKLMKSNTLKICLPNGIDIIKFRATEEEIEELTAAANQGAHMNIVCRCNKNEWNWQVNPQLIAVDYEFITTSGWIF